MVQLAVHSLTEQPLCIVLHMATTGSNRGPRTTCSVAQRGPNRKPHQDSEQRY